MFYSLLLPPDKMSEPPSAAGLGTIVGFCKIHPALRAEHLWSKGQEPRGFSACLISQGKGDQNPTILSSALPKVKLLSPSRYWAE